MSDNHDGDMNKLFAELERIVAENSESISDNTSTSSFLGGKSAVVIIPDFHVISIVLKRSDLVDNNIKMSDFLDRLKKIVDIGDVNNSGVYKKDFLQAKGFSTLVAISSQGDVSKILALQRRKIACSNVMSVSTWRPEQELELRERVAAYHLGQIYFKML